MNEAQPSTITPDAEPTDQRTAGALLKQAREASGLHIAALAVLLKVPVKKLEALESDRFDLLPDVVFGRALASSVCRTLKINPANILVRLPQTDAPKLTYQGTGINEPFRSPGDGPGPSLWAQISRPAVLAGMVLLLGALVLIFLPAIKTGINEIRPEVSKFKAKNMEIEKSMPTATAAEASLAPLAISGGNVASPEPASSITATTAIVGSGASSPTFVATVSPPMAGDIVVFIAKNESWVEATDAMGQPVLRRTLAAGDVVGASGVLPLKVIVGRANAIQVEIRGKLFDVNAVAKDNVARFEVK